MSKVKIHLNDLTRIINEELNALSEASDKPDPEQERDDVYDGASKLRTAINAFKEKASLAALNAVTPHLEALEKIVNNMRESPGSYVTRVKKEPKKVSLRAVKGE